MTSPDGRAATPAQAGLCVRAFLLDLTNDPGGPASADGLPARTRLEARLREVMPAEELPGLVDAAGLALWADTLKLGLSSLVRAGMTSADATAVIDVAINCIDEGNRSSAQPRDDVQTTMLPSIETPTLSCIWRTPPVHVGEYAR